MKKTSFSEICKLMEGNENDIGKCISGIFEIGLLFLPGLVCKDIMSVMNLVNGATILGAKPIIEGAIKNIANVFTNKKYDDFSTKYEHAQIAQVLIVYAAYFDTIKYYLPDEERKIKISEKEKLVLTEESIFRYMGEIEQNALKDAEKGAKDVFEYALPIPNPVEELEEYTRFLEKFYGILNEQFIEFYRSLDFFDSMSEVKRDHFLATIRKLPKLAVKNYEKQYYQLAVNFNDFFVWTNIGEHKKIQKNLDIGFEKISKCIAEYYEKSTHSRAVETLQYYRENYNAYIETSVVEAPEMKYNSADGVIFPSKREIFVPQSFKTLIYKKDMHLEDVAVWSRLDEREDIGKFVGDVLRHSINGSLPLLVLGHPGAGKSLLCHMLAARILCHEYHVIIVKLRDSNAEQTIIQQINEQIERDFSNGGRWNELINSQLDKPLLIIFDGYDELLQASGKAYADYLQKIVEFQESQKNHGISVKCIVTSRITLIDKAEITRNTPVLMLSDFDEERIEQWSKVWNEKNQDYFIREGLKEFNIRRSDKVFELAKQPLLLLMLALYDSNGNALKRNRNISETQLYDNLIREFISREKRKDGGFRSLQKDGRDKLIAQEMMKISIAALGMYNRKKLYIRSGELENDLNFICQEKKKIEELRCSELSESEKLVGSFFFIHKSNATDIVNRERISNTAYEFLHNTFGEFLTADYILTEMKKVISWINTLVESNREEQWKLGSQRAWVVGMAYTPLFSRPVVIRMLHEWVVKCFTVGQIKEINAGLNHLLDFEIPNIVSGEAMFDLKEVMEDKENPYTHEALLKHVAIYSANLVILRTIILGEEYRFEFDDEIWNKIFAIWRYAFSEDELLNFSNQFTIDEVGEKHEMKYLGKEKQEFQNYKNKIVKYMQINSIVGNSALYGIMGALIGEENRIKVQNAIDKNDLNIRARCLWNYGLDRLLYSPYNIDNSISITYHINAESWKENDPLYAFCSAMLLEKLLKNKMIKMEQNDNEKIFEMIMWSAEYIAEYSFTNNEKLLRLILDTVLNLMDYVQFDSNSFSKLVECIQSRYHFWNDEDSYYILKIITKAMEKIPARERKKIHGISMINDYIAKCVNQMLSSIQKNNNTWKQLMDCFNIVENYMKIQQERFMVDAYCFMIEKMILEYYREKGSSFRKNMIFIKSIYILYKYDKKGISDKIQDILAEALQRVNIKKLYKEEITIFDELLFMINEGGLDAVSEQMMHDFLWIARYKGKQLSIGNYQQLYKLAEKIGYDELKQALQQLVE